MVNMVPGGGRVGRLLHGGLLAVAFTIFAWSFLLPEALISGAVGAVAGSILADTWVRRRYRLFVIAAGALGIGLLGWLIMQMLIGSETIAAILGPPMCVRLAEMVRWFAASLAAATTLRALALRYRSALAIEGSVIVVAVATTVEAHRDGMIARPLEISDWFWSQGVDPVIAFLALGLGAAVLLAGVLSQGRSLFRTLVQLSLVLLLGILLASRIHSSERESKEKNAAGEGAAQTKKKRQAGDGAGGKGQKPPDNSPFQDDMPKNGGRGKNTPSAVVVFHKDVRPALGAFYFRHGAFSQFNGVRLVETTRSDVDLDARHDFPIETREVTGAHQTAKGRTLVASDVALLSDHSRMFALVDAVEVAPMANPSPARFRRAYRVVSNVIEAPFDAMLGAEPGDPEWTDEVWEHYTELPRDERYHELAATLRSGLRQEYQSDPLAMAIGVKRYLEESSIYSFARNYEGEEDPTAAFLFSEDRRGYCVHLAHSAAYLLRAMGVPTRVSAGYAVPAENLSGGSALLIKNSDAHAWAEIYLRDFGWVQIEVTPEETDVEPQQFQEKDLQQLLGEMARKEGRNDRETRSGPRLRDYLEAFGRALPWLALVLVLLAYGIKSWRLAAPRFAGQEGAARLSYRAALDRLGAVGILRDYGEPRERFARRVGQTSPTFAGLTAAHVARTLGSREAMRPGRALADDAGAVGREIRSTSPWWRYVLGVLNPLSWVWSR